MWDGGIPLKRGNPPQKEACVWVLGHGGYLCGEPDVLREVCMCTHVGLRVHMGWVYMCATQTHMCTYTGQSALGVGGVMAVPKSGTGKIPGASPAKGGVSMGASPVPPTNTSGETAPGDQMPARSPCSISSSEGSPCTTALSGISTPLSRCWVAETGVGAHLWARITGVGAYL